MYYIIQENLFKKEGHQKLINTLEKFDIPYELVNVRPFIEEVEFKTDRKDVFVFGSLKLSRLSKKYDWVPGTMVTENHDYSVYSKHYKNELLNYDSNIFELGDEFRWDTDLYFIRPTMDSKIFAGKVFNQKEWNEKKNYILTPEHNTTAKDSDLIQVASTKNITQEVRFWIVDGKIVTQSTYRRGSFLYFDNIVDQDAIEYVEKMINIFQLAPAFVMDVGLTKDGWKIIECGSIGCAGFYDADMQKIVMALEDFYNNIK